MVITSEAVQPLSPGWQLTSAVIEVISFFLVTIDLYGKKNLETLNEKLSSLSSRLASLKVMNRNARSSTRRSER
jgi:hypothetical protein